MKSFSATASILIVIVIVSSLGSGVARADRALAVGINRYPGYADMDLGGPVNDVAAMRAVLKKHGFMVTTLTDQQATRSGVLQALRVLRAQMRPDERFVFYFSGHGARDARNQLSLLPHDVRVEERIGNEREKVISSGALSITELHQAVCAIPARGRTLILDAPFPLFRYKTPAPQSTLKRTGQNQGSHKACYFFAARLSEDTNEDVFAGVSYGVFTHFLVKHLNALAVVQSRSKAERGATWHDLVARVSSDVVRYMENRQHPRLSVPYLQSTIFAGPASHTPMQVASVQPGVGKPGARIVESPLVGVRRADEIFKPHNIEIEPKPIFKPSGTWGEWSAFNAHRDRLGVQMRPDKIDVAIGQEVALEVSVAAPGYLVVLERGTSGKVNLMFPSEARIEQARVAATTPDHPLRLPEADFAFVPDAPGQERIRAYWFAEQGAAEALLQHFGDGRSLPNASVLRRPDTVSIEGDNLLTADVLFEVVPPLAP